MPQSDAHDHGSGPDSPRNAGDGTGDKAGSNTDSKDRHDLPGPDLTAAGGVVAGAQVQQGTAAPVRGRRWLSWAVRTGGFLLTLAAGIGVGVVIGRHGQGRGTPSGPVGARGAGERRSSTRTGGPAADRGAVETADAGVAGQDVLVDVLDASGQPLAGVSVIVLRADGRGAAGSQRLEAAGELGVLRGSLPFPRDVIGGETGAGALATERAQSDGQGTARLVNVPSGRVQILASHEGMVASAEIVVRAAPDGNHLGRNAAGTDVDVPHVVLRLAPPPPLPEGGEAAGGSEADVETAEVRAPLSGVVLDDRSFGLPGVRVEVRMAGQRIVALTGARGDFVLRGLRAGIGTIVIQHPGFAPLVRPVPLGDEALRLQLGPGGGIEGEVRDRRLGGVPARARLSLTSGGVERQVPMGRDGRFRQAGLPPGEATLVVRAPGYAPLRKTVQVGAAAEPGGISLRDVLLELEQAGAIAGRVRDQAGGAAALALIKVTDGDGAAVGQGTAGARGEFRITGLPAGRLTVTATQAANGPAPEADASAAAGPGEGTASQTVEVREGGEERLELELR